MERVHKNIIVKKQICIASDNLLSPRVTSRHIWNNLDAAETLLVLLLLLLGGTTAWLWKDKSQQGLLDQPHAQPHPTMKWQTLSITPHAVFYESFGSPVCKDFGIWFLSSKRAAGQLCLIKTQD